MDWPTTDSEYAEDDGPVTTEVFYDLTNLVHVNKYGTKDEISWAVMGQKEVQYQLNYAEEYGICRNTYPFSLLEI